VASSGWYNDESDPALARWHDGVAWTDHVLEKSEWEAAGVEPPPPEEWLDDPYVPGRMDRRRAVVAGAVAVALLAVGGVALARDGGDGRSPRPSTDGTSAPTDRVDDATGASIDVPALDAGTVVADPGTGPAAVGGSSTPGRGTTRSSRSTPSTTSGGVRRSETATQTHTNAGPQSTPGAATPGDKVSIGHTNDTTISTTYVPPPPTSSTSSTAPPDTTPDTTPPPEDTSPTAP
jgi:hypothetical protein